MQPSPYVIPAQCLPPTKAGVETQASRHQCLYSWVPAFAGMTEGSEPTPRGITPTDPLLLGRPHSRGCSRREDLRRLVSHQLIRKCRHAGNQYVRLVRRRAEWTLATVDERRAHAGR